MTKGFTLLEMLLTTALLAAVTGIAFNWVITQTRSCRLALERLRTAEAALGVQRALDDDLLLAFPLSGQPCTVVDDHTLVLTTLNRMPGDIPGAQMVTWHFDDEHHLLLRDRLLPGDDIRHAARPITWMLRNWSCALSARGELHVLMSLGPETSWQYSWPQGRP
jgi:prepilin-type N-terminal cleavage/methylation domain-containing protein